MNALPFFPSYLKALFILSDVLWKLGSSPVFVSLIIALVVFDINRSKERKRIIEELKNEIIRICDKLRVCHSMIKLNHANTGFYEALSKLWEDVKEVRTADKYLKSAEDISGRANDYVQEYNFLESDLLKHVSTLSIQIPEGKKLKVLWDEFNSFDVTYKKYNYRSLDRNTIIPKHEVELEILMANLNDRKSIPSLYKIQNLLNPRFFPKIEEYKRHPIAGVEMWKSFRVQSSNPTTAQTNQSGRFG